MLTASRALGDFIDWTLRSKRKIHSTNRDFFSKISKLFHIQEDLMKMINGCLKLAKYTSKSGNIRGFLIILLYFLVEKKNHQYVCNFFFQHILGHGLTIFLEN